MGACTAAFRLIDALLAPATPGCGTGTPAFDDPSRNQFHRYSYPTFRLMREAVQGKAELIAVSYANRTDLTYGSEEEMEKAHLQ